LGRVTIPAVPAPHDGSIRTPLDFKLKSEWYFETKSRTFKSSSGDRFSPRGDLPRGSRIVYKTPKLAQADPSALNEHERELRRYMQVILPHGESPAKYVPAVRAWPSVEEAYAGPDVSLPGRF
jgi:hypothetical protein